MTVKVDCDVAIIGGGIIGLAIAQHAAKIGHRIVLYEAGQCGRGASGNSLRIIHGGFRYLQSLDVVRVIESVRAQTKIFQEYPELVKPLPCLMPLAKFGLKSRLPVKCALAFYDQLARLFGRNLPAGGVLDSSEVERVAPTLKGLVSSGALLWFDGLLVDPEGLISRLKGDILASGGEIFENSPIEHLSDLGGHCELQVGVATKQARIVVNTGGASCKVLTQYRGKWVKAFNVVISRQFEAKYGFGVNGGGRLFFVVPRDNGSAIGTQYLLSPNKSIDVSTNEVADFLAAFNKALPSAAVSASEIVKIECGLLPIVRESAGQPILTSREIIQKKGRIIEVVSNKYTTFPIVMEKVMREMSKVKTA